ncbi:hypothetical protein FRC01_004613 [Tulasnella sp. 417]|nr:hypothetical protein FRC01_004613 [Tulasnella sp. 417]
MAVPSKHTTRSSFRPTQVVTLMESARTQFLKSEVDSAPRSPPSPAPSINNAFPPELLLSVFDVIYAEMIQQFSHTLTKSQVVAMHKRHALLDAMLVCRAWHDLVVATPQYWTMVNVGIWESLGSSQRGTGRSGNGEAQRMNLQRQLKRSGELPIQINVQLDSVEDPAAVVDLLRNQAHRWQALNLLPTWRTGLRRPIRQNQLSGLFDLPLPCLTSLNIGRRLISPDLGEGNGTTSWQVGAPHLRALSCDLRLVIPTSPSHLRYLSIANIDLEDLQPFPDELSVELGQLVELRITTCNLGAILSTFSAPILNKLIVEDCQSDDPPLKPLPQYQHLKELQWEDFGPDPTFAALVSLCPNLRLFSNYIAGREGDLSSNTLFGTPTILLNIRRQARAEDCLWPNMMEILLDCATCTEIAELIDAMPSIQKVTVLQDPTTDGRPEDQTRESQLLERLREKISIVVWFEP